MRYDSSAALELLQHAQGRKIQVDSRKVRPGDVFVALEGRKSDGHLFIADAMQRGAHSVVASKHGLGASLVFEDPLSVMHKAAQIVLSSCTRATRVAITGSNGKTTTKEIVGFLLSKLGKTFKTPGNLNTDIGVPAAIIEGAKLLFEADFAVFEIATDTPGDISTLTSLVEPSIAVLLNVGTAHVGNFGSEKALFEEKLSVFTSFPGIKTAIINCDDERIVGRIESLDLEKLYFGKSGGDFKIGDYSYRDGFTLLAFNTQEGTKMTRLRGTWHPGNLFNLGAAYLVARKCGMDEPALYLPSFTLGNDGRFSIKRVSGIFVVDDTYNSSPESIRVAVESIDKLHVSGRKIAVVGSILEQGENSSISHRKAAESLAGFDIVLLFTKDEQVLSMNSVIRPAFASSDIDEVAAWLWENKKTGDLVYFKASRAIELERVVTRFMEMITGVS